jgi:alpha-1,2-mannosyltransferase
VVAAVVLWATALVLLSTPGSLDRLGQLKGRDFAFFYTLGHLVNTGQVSRMYDMDAEHEVRAELVPASASDAFASAYPPQTALAFAPFARLPYGLAFATWMLVTAVVYFAGVLIALRRSRLDRTLVMAAAAAFPPFWNLMLGGQSTSLPLLGVTLGWLALSRGASLTAGAALGLIAIKPQLGLVLVVVTLWNREWRLIAGAALSIGAQLGLACVLMGGDIVVRYFRLFADAGHLRQLLQPHAYQVQSIQALADLLPAALRLPAWMIGAAALAAIAARTWNRVASLEVRLAIVTLASVLASPHLLVYDLALVALPLIWIGAFCQSAPVKGRLAALYYVACLTLLLPTAGVLRIQLSVIALVAVLWVALREAHTMPTPANR